MRFLFHKSVIFVGLNYKTWHVLARNLDTNVRRKPKERYSINHDVKSTQMAFRRLGFIF